MREIEFRYFTQIYANKRKQSGFSSSLHTYMKWRALPHTHTLQSPAIVLMALHARLARYLPPIHKSAGVSGPYETGACDRRQYDSLMQAAAK